MEVSFWPLLVVLCHEALGSLSRRLLALQLLCMAPVVAHVLQGFISLSRSFSISLVIGA